VEAVGESKFVLTCCVAEPDEDPAQPHNFREHMK
jgi:hypothetical protein